jgi:hypothetical protein
MEYLLPTNPDLINFDVFRSMIPSMNYRVCSVMNSNQSKRKAQTEYDKAPKRKHSETPAQKAATAAN